MQALGMTRRGFTRMIGAAAGGMALAGLPATLAAVRCQGGAFVDAVVAALGSTAEVERRAGALRSGVRSGWLHGHLGT